MAPHDFPPPLRDVIDVYAFPESLLHHASGALREQVGPSWKGGGGWQAAVCCLLYAACCMLHLPWAQMDGTQQSPGRAEVWIRRCVRAILLSRMQQVQVTAGNATPGSIPASKRAYPRHACYCCSPGRLAPVSRSLPGRGSTSIQRPRSSSEGAQPPAGWQWPSPGLQRAGLPQAACPCRDHPQAFGALLQLIDCRRWVFYDGLRALLANGPDLQPATVWGKRATQRLASS